MITVRLVSGLLAAAACAPLFAQESTEKLKENADKAQAVFDARSGSPKDTALVEVMPAFPGGEKAMFAYLGRETKYPQEALDQGIMGKVFVQFTVEQDGRVDSVFVKRGAHPALDAEAVRVVSSMPNWSPGRQRGKAVRTRYTLPISFTMNEKDLERVRRKAKRKE